MAVRGSMSRLTWIFGGVTSVIDKRPMGKVPQVAKVTSSSSDTMWTFINAHKGEYRVN